MPSIARINLAGIDENTLPPHLREEQRLALRNLVAASSFTPGGDTQGPYDVTLALDGTHLVLSMTNAQGKSLNTLALSFRPYKRLIRDYFLMLDSYEQARRHATRDKLEAIDMGRRGVHNEGADLLRARLQGKIEMDHETARKFFTLLCVLHKNEVRLAG